MIDRECKHFQLLYKVVCEVMIQQGQMVSVHGVTLEEAHVLRWIQQDVADQVVQHGGAVEVLVPETRQ